MKTLNKQIGIMGICLALLVGPNLFSQEKIKDSKLFVRVYDLEGKKINKGKVFAVNDTLLFLKRGNKSMEVSVKEIGFIRTKRSAGHNVLMGTIIGATATTIVSVASIDPDDGFIIDATPDNFGEALVGGVVLGGIAGSAVGAITIPFKNSKTFLINGDAQKWKVFQEMVSNWN